MSGASLYDFRDLDIFLALKEHANGGVSSKDLAELLGLGEEGSQGAAVRLTWMKRYGMVAREESSWRLTPSAERVTEAKLRAAQATTLADIPEESLVEVMAHVTQRWRSGDPMTAALLRREFLFGTKRR